MPRIGILGCGFIGRVHSWALWALRESGLADARVTHLCDTDPERARELAEPHGAEATSDPEEVFAEVDAIFVCTPTAGHLELVERAASRGLAVFCEKPLAPTIDDCERVAESLAAVPHQVGLVLRSAPVFREVRDRIASERHGRVLTMLLRDDQFFPIQGHYASTWRSEAAVAGGGTLIEHSIHDLDLFRWLLGEPCDASCTTASFFEHPGVDDLAAATLRYRDGRVASLTSVWHQVLSRASTRRLEVFCTDALLWCDDDYTGPLHVETSAGEEVVECPPAPWVDELPVPGSVRRALGQYAEADKRFCDRLAGRSDDAPQASDALETHRLVDACYRSAADGGAVIRL